MAEERGIVLPAFRDIDPALLQEPEEIKLMKTMARYPETISGAAKALEPHRITFYLNELASLFHSYYNKNKVISDNEKLTAARLFFMQTIRFVLQNALKILGVGAPEKM